MVPPLPSMATPHLIAHRGRYRYYLVAPRDRVALAGHTPSVVLSVSRNVGGAGAPR